MQARAQILANFKTIKISKRRAERIIEHVNNLLGETLGLKALAFFTQITDVKSQREELYQHSDYLAEYYNTLSNLGLIAVGLYYHDTTTLAAGVFSALSHAVPLQRLHDLDLLGVALVLAKGMVNYEIILQRPDVLLFAAIAGGVGVIDTYLNRNNLIKNPVPHSTWHGAAAFGLFKFNQAVAEVAQISFKSK